MLPVVVEVGFARRSVIEVIESRKVRFQVVASTRIEAPFIALVETFDFPFPNATGWQHHISSHYYTRYMYLQLK